MMNTARVTNVFVGGNRPGQNDHGFGHPGGMGHTGGGRGPTGGGWGSTSPRGVSNQLSQIQGQIQSLIGQLGGHGTNRQGALRQLIQLRNQLRQLLQLAGGNNPIISRLLNTLNTILGRFGVPSTGGGNGFPGAGGNGGWGGNGFPGAGGNGGWGGNGFPGAGGNGGWGGNGFPGGNGNGFGNNPFGNNGFGNNPFGNNGFGNDPFGLGGFGNGLGGLNGQNGLNGLGGQNGGFPNFNGNNGNNGIPGQGAGGGQNAPANDGKVWGDPRYQGADGEVYDVHGEPGKIYNLLSDSGLQVNTQYKAWGAGVTVQDKIGITYAGHQIEFAQGGKVRIDGEEVKDGSYLNGIVTRAGNKIDIETGEYKLSVADSDGHHGLTFTAASKNAAADGVMPHGLWGQTADGDGQPRKGEIGAHVQGGGVIEGANGITEKGDKEAYKLYEVNNLFDTQFANFNRYWSQGNPMLAQAAAQAGGLEAIGGGGAD